MNHRMFRSAQTGEIPNGVVQRVPIHVVDHRLARCRTVGRLPDHNGTRAPHVRLGSLDPGTPIVAPIYTHADRDRADRETIGWRHCTELGATTSTLTLGWRSKVASPLRRAGVRAVVHGHPFGGLAMELDATDGACDGGCSWATTSKRRAVGKSAGGATEQAGTAPQAIWLDVHCLAAVSAGRVHPGNHTGSGTTLVVAA